MENQTPVIRLHERRDFGRKISVTFEFLKLHYKSLFRAILYLAGPPALLASVFGGDFYSRFLNTSMDLGRNPQNSEAALEYFQSANFWLEVIGFFVFTLITFAMMLSLVINYIAEYERTGSTSISVDRIWQLIRQTMGNFIGTALYYIGIIILLFIAVFFIIGIFSIVNPLLSVLGMFVAMLGVYYIIIVLSLLVYVRAFEKKDVITATSRCFYLIRGKWWSTFGLTIIIGLIVSTVSSIFFIPWYINFIITMMHSLENNTFEEPSLISQIISNVFLILYFLSSFILYAIPIIALAFQYFNLVELKEAKGLMSRIETLGQQETKPLDEQY